jgi:GntR family transcriptional regulator, vanillate catabolism transcriptional regulator
MRAATAPAPVAEMDGAAPGASQTVRAQLGLRALIVGGELNPGTRIAELALVERLGMSRTPIRAALVRLQEEGLLEALPSGGFIVKDFSEHDIVDAIELRGTLEGLAARLAAERGVSAVVLAEVRECIERIDELFAQPVLSEESFSGYVEQNARFHQLLAEMSGSALVQRQIERVVTLPFASPNGFVLVNANGPRARDRLVIAQEQHRAVVEAIVQREGARAESLMREHARVAQQNMREALLDHRTLQKVPGAKLIRRSLAR